MEYEIHYYGEYEIKKVKYEVKHGRKLYIYDSNGMEMNIEATLICRVQETFLQHNGNPCPVVDRSAPVAQRFSHNRLARCNGGHVIFVGRQWRVLSRSFCVYVVLCHIV